MKEFEKWWYEEGNWTKFSVEDDRGFVDEDSDRAAEVAWRTALKWVLSQSESVPRPGRCDINIISYRVIKEELGE